MNPTAGHEVKISVAMVALALDDATLSQLGKGPGRA
jgi:hypothetical protein